MQLTSEHLPLSQVDSTFVSEVCLSRSLLIFEVILDVEYLPDLLRLLALHHFGHLAARHVQEPLDVQVVGRQDQLEEGALVDL